MNTAIIGSGTIGTLLDNTEKDRGIFVIDRGYLDNFGNVMAIGSK